MRRSWLVSLAAVTALALALPASAQMMGQTGQGGQMGGMMQGGMMGGGMMGHGMREGRGDRMMSHEGPLLTMMLEHAQELGLNPEQEKKLRDLRTEFAKESVRRTAEARVAEIELDSLLEQDQWDLAKIEPKVKQVAALRGDLRLARIKTLAAGRAVLTPDQLQKFRQVGHRMRGMGGEDMMGPGMMGGRDRMGPGHSPGPGGRGHEGPPAPRQ
ncbi:MAG TPA: periplasmic heavy metal sensor [Candidatus Methylomirabilis sp.]|nr:periplasmic heavy metal sensor [Candidatus Methylomirabilis sp.]